MTSKTIALSGAEIRADYSGGANAWLRNDGTTTVYASTIPGVTAGADGVVSIPAGQAVRIDGAYRTVYLLGTGSVQLVGSDYTACPFKTSAQSGGSGADSVARAAIEAHAADADIHVTAAEKAYWNTLSGKNELINPDFQVNQRGQSEYVGSENYLFTVDGWRVGFGNTQKKLAVSSDGSISFGSETDMQYLVQIVEKPERLVGDYTLSFCIPEISGGVRLQIVEGGDSVSSPLYSAPGTYSLTKRLSGNAVVRAQLRAETGTDVSVKWAKLELGNTATPFTPPDSATELAKCQRYYQVRTTNDIDPLDLRPSMRTITDIKAVEGGYAYVAEL